MAGTEPATPNRETPPSTIPASFRAFVTEQAGTAVARGVRPFTEADLATGEVEIRVLSSDVNDKDGLATIAGGKVTRISPLPGSTWRAKSSPVRTRPSPPARPRLPVPGVEFGRDCRPAHPVDRPVHPPPPGGALLAAFTIAALTGVMSPWTSSRTRSSSAASASS